MPNIHQALIIEATAESVYNAITSPQGLSGWWTPGSRIKAGTEDVFQFPFGDNYYKEMKVTESKPFELVKWNCIRGDGEWVGTNISFQLLAGTKLYPHVCRM